MAKDTDVKQVSHEVLEQRLLISLSEDDKVACIFTADDLIQLINALASKPNPTLQQNTILCGLYELLVQAFPEKNNPSPPNIEQ